MGSSYASLAFWALPSLGELRGESKRNAKGRTVVATAEIQSTGLFDLKNWFSSLPPPPAAWPGV